MQNPEKEPAKQDNPKPADVKLAKNSNALFSNPAAKSNPAAEPESTPNLSGLSWVDLDGTGHPDTWKLVVHQSLATKTDFNFNC